MIYHNQTGICFACGRPFFNETVVDYGGHIVQGDISGVFHGVMINVVMHVKCADWLATGMKRDVLEAKLGEAAANQWYANYKREAPL